MSCDKCKDEKWVEPENPGYRNCELGGDCEKDNDNHNKEICKICGKIKCPDCNTGRE